MKFDQDFSMTINGVGVTSAENLEVVNPATGKAFAKVPDCTAEQLDAAAESSAAAFNKCKNVPIEERAEYLCKIGKVITANADELTELFTREHGRPLSFARLEIESCEAWLNSVADVRPPVHITEDSNEQFIET